jgi:CRP-like cAMP-binding protein
MGTDAQDEKIELLRHLPLFEGVTETALQGLATGVRPLRVKRRDELFHKGDDGSFLHLVVEGRFKAMTTSLLGDDVVFEVMGPGDVFGESGFTRKVGRTQTVRAIDPGCVLVVDNRELSDFLRGHPEVSLRLLDLLSQRVRTLCEFFEDVHFLKLPQRLAKKLLTLSERFGQTRSNGVRIDLRLSQEEWGDLVGATRESVNKQLKIWGEAGLVERQRGLLLITDLPEIERLAHLDEI